MAIVFAEHATAGEYHLETFYSEGQWEWKVIAIRNKKLPEYAGESKTPQGAKKSAMATIGLLQADWAQVGKAFEVPD